MKHLKTYEKIFNKDNLIGKYVVLKEYPYLRDYIADHNKLRAEELDTFVRSTPGLVTKKEREVGIGDRIQPYLAKYENLPERFNHYFTREEKEVPFDMSLFNEERFNQAIFVGTYDECDAFIAANKYNI